MLHQPQELRLDIAREFIHIRQIECPAIGGLTARLAVSGASGKGAFDVSEIVTSCSVAGRAAQWMATKRPSRRLLRS